MNFRVVKEKCQREWNNVLSKVENYDFYHTPSYHRLHSGGESCLLVFEDGNDCMAIPLIFREIPTTPFKDVTSVYGYAGWIRSSQADFPEAFEAMHEYFNEQQVVSAFSRLHPLIKGADLFYVGDVAEVGMTAGIDLTLPEEIQLRSYSESVRRFIRNKTKKGIDVRLTASEEDIDEFVNIYKGAMKRLKASSHYYFSSDYFRELFHSADFESFILFAEYNKTIIGGGLFVVCGQIMQYHLGAVVADFMHYSPLKMIIDKARIIGNERKLSIFHLGGGYGGEENNLYVFKQRMSTSCFPFKVWRWIVDEDRYKELSNGKMNSSFFPSYRS